MRLKVNFSEGNSSVDVSFEGGDHATDVKFAEFYGMTNGSGINISGAEAGQVPIIKAVDENGKPTEWGAESVATAVDALEALAECGVVTPAYQDGVFYTDADGAIYVL